MTVQVTAFTPGDAVVALIELYKLKTRCGGEQPAWVPCVRAAMGAWECGADADTRVRLMLAFAADDTRADRETLLAVGVPETIVDAIGSATGTVRTVGKPGRRTSTAC
jgi:hypothetical protein